MDLLTVSMGVALGVAVDAALTHGLAGFQRGRRDGTRIAFTGAAVAVAVGAVAVLAMYSADSAESHATIMKWLLFPASSGWTVALVWLVAYYSGVRPARWLLALTAAFGAMVVVDLWLPHGLLRAEVGELRPIGMAGTDAVRVVHAAPHLLNLITVALTMASFAFMVYAIARMRNGGQRGKGGNLTAVVVLFALSMLVDSLTDYGVLTSFYTTELCFAAVVLAVSIALRREALEAEEELIAYRTQLESMVAARVRDLDQANEQLAREARVRLSAQESLRRQVAELDALQHLSQTLTQSTDLATTLERAGREVAAFFSACFACVHLAPLDEGGEGDDFSSGGGAPPGEWEASLRAAPMLVRAVRRREATVIADTEHDTLPFGLADRARRDGARSLLLVPMVARDEVVGVLSIARCEYARAFEERELKLAQTVAESLAAVVAIERLHRRDTRAAAVGERQRLARELHDAVTQTIYSAALVSEALPEVWERDPREGSRNLRTLRLLVRGALAEMRTLLFELRPGALQAAPLDALLERLGEALSGQTQTPVTVEIAPRLDLPAEVKIALYRVAQEAFSNVAKHAQASSATARVTADDGLIVLTVHDDGRGFEPSSVTKDHMGLRIMRERLEQIGASLRIESAPRQGTTVVAAWERPAGAGPDEGSKGAA